MKRGHRRRAKAERRRHKKPRQLHSQYPVHWTTSDDSASQAEGWAIYDFGGGLEIEMIDDLQCFTCDAEAVAYVMRRAAAGSQLHSRALEIHRRYANVPRC